MQEIVTIDVKPGWKEGTKITFAGKGDERPGRPAGDIVFVIREQNHPRFQRHGNNLHYTARINLVSALTGGTLEIETLDGRRVPVSWSEPVTPGTERVVRGEGMPISKAPGTKGDLVVKFDVVFPRQLSDMQKQQLRQILV